jgi:competence protein ComEA
VALAALFISVAAARRASTPAFGPEPATSAGTSAPSADSRLDLNTATAAQLELLPRIGPALARRIVEFRDARGPFTSIDQLDEVQGIGPRTLELVAPLVRIAPPSESTPRGE